MLYPKSYRQKYEEEILLTTADMLDNSKDTKTRLVLWSQLAFDLPVNVVRQNLEYIGSGMQRDMPSYIKRNSLISGLLLLPFFGAITANMLDRLLNHANFNNSWLWHRPALILWVFYLPAVAFLISLVSYCLFVFGGASSKAWFKRALDLLHSWPVLIVGIMAFGILFLVEFHDSTQCVLRSPIHAISSASQTLNCIEANRAIIPRHDFNL